jgi:hypothetical protein
MPDQSGRTTTRDFAFQSTDQAFTHQLGGAGPEGAKTATIFAPQANDRYEAADLSSNALPSASPALNQTPGSDASLRYSDFSASHSSQSISQPSQPSARSPFSNYNFAVWDWDNSIELADFTSHYEPQGELVQELQNQSIPTNDFSIPLPITPSEPPYASPQPPQSAATTIAQNPLSPPPKPPQRPAVQTGMKRKAESEPNSAISQSAGSTSEVQQGPAKRPNKSRSSSSASITSPTVTAPSGASRSSMTQVTLPPVSSEPQVSSNTTASIGPEQQRKKELAKGTGPQGRVIDVSKPRRIVESPSGHDVLPAGKVFPIQIGSELFRLSGASISSDGRCILRDLGPRGTALTMLEHPHISPIFLQINSIITRVVPVT